MATLTQEQWPIAVTTPLGADVLSLVGFTGEEVVSHLFRYQLEVIAKNETSVSFDKLLGQPINVRMVLEPQGKRFIHGICSRVSQAERDEKFTMYRMEVVPKLWLLTQRAQSRIFQHISVPDILKKVLAGLDVNFQIQGTFDPRDYCVQYRETDFNFVSRLMEEEGIYYYFDHSEDKHVIVIANAAAGHADLPVASEVLYRMGEPVKDQFMVVDRWEKSQELRAGKVTLWDHCFELPHKHLEASKTIMPNVQVGGVTHSLQVGNNGQLEKRDWPGGYAQRFDGIDPGGGEQPSQIQKIFQDNQRTVGLRMQEEAASSLEIQGGGHCRNFVAGHKFKLKTLEGSLEKESQADGDYVLTQVRHTAKMSGYRSEGPEFMYQNDFTCIPVALPFRPQRTTPKPVVQGTQTAVVVGPAGEEIFTDKYGRIKVQFHWDAQGKNNADSSCWCRVATPWAGKQWGMIQIPRMGWEVMVAFEDGDPDKPFVMGSVYNAEQMPPYALPDNKTQSGIKTRSSLGGTEENFNEICFEDKKGEELLYIRAEKDHKLAVENDEAHWVGNDQEEEIDHDRHLMVHNDETVEIDGNRRETVVKDEEVTIKGDRAHEVKKNASLAVDGQMSTSVSKDESLDVDGKRTKRVGKDEDITIEGGRKTAITKDEIVTINGQMMITIDKKYIQTVTDSIVIEGKKDLLIKVGPASVIIKDGKVQICAKEVNVACDSNIKVKGSKIALN
jgi:type VI secretion system secreted protein VgrG